MWFRKGDVIEERKMASPASSDEGEINESAPQHSKATTSHRSGGTMVDLQDRSRGRYSNSRSPDRYDSDRRRHAAGPPRRSSRSPRGFKRGRDDRDSYHGSGRGGGDPRQFRGHYEDRDGYSYRSRALPYEDLDRPTGGGYRYDSDRDRQQRDRGSDRYADKRPRHARSRSPPGRRGGGGGGRGGGRDDRSRRERDYVNGGHSEAIKYDQHERDPRDQSKRAALSQPSTVSTHDAKTAKGSADDLPTADAVTTQQEYVAALPSRHPTSRLRLTGQSRSAPAPQPEPEPEPEVEEEQPIDEDAEIERRRRRREEILARSRQETPLLVQALQPKAISAVSSPGHIQDSTSRRTEANTPREGTPDIGRLLGVVEAADRRATESPALSTTGPQDGDSPHAIEISNDQELINLHGNARSSEEDGPSAADYDPTVDMKEDGRRDELRHGNVGLHGEPKVPETVLQSIEQETVETATAAKSEDDDFDMFAEDFDEEKYTAPKPPRAAASSKAIEEATLPPVVGNAGGILEGDDKDGYYKIRIGEILNGRYQVQSTLGKGMFSSVARAVDITNKKLVAIKIMRNNDALRKGGFTEIAILQKLNEADPENRKHIVKFERHFDHKGHLCMAFENLSLNLREVLRKFGNNIGINLNATRAYAHQIFVALAHLKKCSIIHADLKPDNILVSLIRMLVWGPLCVRKRANMGV